MIILVELTNLDKARKLAITDALLYIDNIKAIQHNMFYFTQCQVNVFVRRYIYTSYYLLNNNNRHYDDLFFYKTHTKIISLSLFLPTVQVCRYPTGHYNSLGSRLTSTERKHVVIALFLLTLFQQVVSANFNIITFG